VRELDQRPHGALSLPFSIPALFSLAQWKLFEDQHAGFATEWKNFRVVNQGDQKLQVVALAKAAGMMQLSVEAFLQQRHQLQQAKLHNPHFAGAFPHKWSYFQMTQHYTHNSTDRMVRSLRQGQ